MCERTVSVYCKVRSATVYSTDLEKRSSYANDHKEHAVWFHVSRHRVSSQSHRCMRAIELVADVIVGVQTDIHNLNKKPLKRRQTHEKDGWLI